MLDKFFQALKDEQQKKIKFGTLLQLKEIHRDLTKEWSQMEKLQIGALDEFAGHNVSISHEALLNATENEKHMLARLTRLVQIKKKEIENKLNESKEMSIKFEKATLNYMKQYDDTRGEHIITGNFTEIESKIHEKVALITDFYYGLAAILDDQSKLHKRKTFDLTLKEHLSLIVNTTEELLKVMDEVEKTASTKDNMH